MNPWLCGFLIFAALLVVALMIAATVLRTQRLSPSATPPSEPKCPAGFTIESIGSRLVCSSLTVGKWWANTPTAVPDIETDTPAEALADCAGTSGCKGVFQLTQPFGAANPGTNVHGFKFMKWYGIYEGVGNPTVADARVGNVNINLLAA